MSFINDDFLLESDAAVRLYYEYAAGQPIIDYHCHLKPEEISADLRWDNLTQIWLGGDHYKWRAMRSNGVDEHFITGTADDRSKFQKFAETMPYLLRNPLYHWCHLELKRYFGIGDLLLNGDTAEEIWRRANNVLQSGMSARGLMTDSRVELVCTTDDPLDDLAHHRNLAEQPFGVTVLPTWRPDKLMQIENGDFRSYIAGLSAAADVDIACFGDFVSAVEIRHAYFHDNGCRLSDHGIERPYSEHYTDGEIRTIFDKAVSGGRPGGTEILKFKSAMMHLFGRLDSERGWTKQLHIGAVRNNNSRMFRALGPDTGFDSIDDRCFASDLAAYMDRLDSEGSLPKMILYNLNPRDNEVIATMLGNFQDGSIPGKIQMGSGWWFLDQKDGMQRQIEALSQLGLLSRFVGMLTDSRSFLSYTRHEYFRRILCNILGGDMERGLIPADTDLVGRMVEDICYKNAASYFGFRHRDGGSVV